MMKPPIAAPIVFPIPPRTAAVNAFRPAKNPRLNWMLPKYRPWITPAAPARAAAMKNVIAIVWLMSTPMSSAASRSWAVERIARPSRVRPTNTCRATISNSATTSMKMFRRPMLPPAMSSFTLGKIWGTLIGEDENSAWMMFCRMNETPIAVISGASLGAWRRGRYAKRSMITPTEPMTTIVAKTTRTRMPPSLIGSSIGRSSSPSGTVMIHIATNAPTMNTSPWAKLMSSMIP